MKILIAMDSFKGSLSSIDADNAVMLGIRRVYKKADIITAPLADGGEGTANTLIDSLNGVYRKADVHDPLGREITAEYGILPDNTAVIEIASASGLLLLKPYERNIMKTSSYGTGELIKAAIENGCRKFIIGLGGSAVNDAGTGLLTALGLRFLDKNNAPIAMGAQGLSELRRIDYNNIMPELNECKFYCACDVSNPLCGENGCSYVFAPQKGADPIRVAEMDKSISDFAVLTRLQYNSSADPNAKGAGAAGGIGFALTAYLKAKMESGIDLVIRETELEEKIKSADIIVTGEGCLDGQTPFGKAPCGIAKTAKKYRKLVIAIGGCVKKGAEKCNEAGIDAFFPIIRSPAPLEELMLPNVTVENLADTTEQIFRLINSI